MPGQASRQNGLKGGRPKGRKNDATLSKDAGRELLREIVLRELEPMTRAQIENAKGIKYLVVREKKTGKFVRVTEAMARQKLGDTEEIIEVWEKDPATPAFTDLLNRALDKPKEQAQDINLTGDDALIAALMHGRQRAAQR